MPTKLPTEAANADFLGEDPDDKSGEPPPIGADGTPRGHADGTPEPPEHSRKSEAMREASRSDDKPGTKKDSDT